MDLPAPRTRDVCLFLAAMTLAVFWPVVTHGFIDMDDHLYVADGSHARDGLSLSAVGRAFTTVQYDNWTPLTLISHKIDVRIFGLKPWGHHLMNLLIHAANVLLLFLSLRRMTADGWRSAFVAAVFAVHPLQVESVAWVAERKNVLSSLFCLAALWNYAAYVERPSRRRQAAILLSFAAALLSKASAVTLPCLLLLLDYWPLGRWRKDWRSCLAEKAPLFALAAAAGLVALFSAHLRDLRAVPAGIRLANAAVSGAAYARKAFWPGGLSVYYSYHRGALNLWSTIGAVSLLAGVSLAVFRLRREKPCLLAGWSWFLVALAPMLGLLQVGSQAMADRYAYLPLIGLAAMAAWAVPSWTGRRAGAAALAAAALVCALMVAAGLQVRYWRDSVTLFEHALAVDPDNPIMLNNLGAALGRSGETGRAVLCFRRALELDPRDLDARGNLGLSLAAQGDLPGAVAQFSEVVRRDPTRAGSREHLERTRALLERSRGRD
ncbi:MAG: tetratricopeptide repeat protein [Elusimicrobia bacterium]|nr:tetratricopeptide repeat protein [Elusimicrobiota bacterium]